ncbi:hypothetical protein ABZW18_11865 [Streptomyces sp. NPDC004647]|uniref:hypothetical protein n=1 Tax=Streptomyces sp. NPDC004647 TaxID=3154671 RepID=UPI0033AD51AE
MHAMYEIRAEHAAQPGTGTGAGPATRAGPGAGAAGRKSLSERIGLRRKSRREREDRDLGPVELWHMVRSDFSATTALCGRELDPRAAAQPEDAWGMTREPFCHTCGAVYLRQVP